jgi:CRISPR type IV-associated protein Csf3
MMESLLITAKLERGFSANDPWSPAIDGILAYYHLRETMGVEAFNLSLSLNEQTVVNDLPLEKVTYDDKWWWACSSPDYDLKQEIIRTFYKKFNIDTSLLIKDRVKNIELTKNKFKNYSLSFKEIITKEIHWQVVGDKEEIIRLLSMCYQVGAQRGKGMGVIESWSVTESEDAKEDAKKAMFNRPIPLEAAEHHNISGLKAWRGYKPSVRVAENQGLCICPIKHI